MNLREWARATYGTISRQSVEFHHPDFSTADIEMILRIGVNTLVDAMTNNDDLRLDTLGHLWVEKKQSHKMTSNLGQMPQQFSIPDKRVVRFRASKRFMTRLNRLE